MVAFSTSSDGGIVRPVTIDGTDLGIFPDTISVNPTPIFESVDTIDGGSVLFYPSLPGSANLADRYEISFPITAVEGVTRRALERIRARGGYHTLAIWKPISAFYVATAAGVYLLPRYRQNAGQVLAGLNYGGEIIGTDTAPFLAWRNSTELTVSYVATPGDLTTPGATDCIVSAAPYTSGSNIDYVPFAVGGLTPGDVIEIEFFPVFIVTMTAPQISFPMPLTETHNYTFLER